MSENKSKVEIMAEQVKADLALKDKLLELLADYNCVLQNLEHGQPEDAKSMMVGVHTCVNFPAYKEENGKLINLSYTSAKTRKAYASAVRGTIADLQKEIDKLEAKYGTLLK